MTTLQTSRLLLRPPTPGDAPAYALGVGDYEVARFLTPLPYPYSLAMAADWLRSAPSPTPERCLFIVELPGKGLIGCVSLGTELGYWIARPHWNRGYVTEAVTALLHWRFAALPEGAVTCAAHHNNRASLAVQRRLGFVPIGRELRFSQALQHNVEHIVSTLDLGGWQNRSAAA